MATNSSNSPDPIADALLTLIEKATSPEAMEAQNIILRRIALQGDVVPSRVPAPINITQIGGYINLLGALNEVDMRAQVLAGILGVAGPNPPLGWLTTATALSFVNVVNDRPVGPGQQSIPVTVPIRSDYADPLLTSLQALHDQGCMLPFLTTPSSLPPAGFTFTAPADALPYLGRVLLLASTMAMQSPATDPLLLARTGSSGAFTIAANALTVGTVPVVPANYEALQVTSSGISTVALTAAKLVFIGPLLAQAGFYPASPAPQPVSGSDTAWARLTNITGLVAAQTTLGDELSLLYPWADIVSSVFAKALSWRWDGGQFAAPI